MGLSCYCKTNACARRKKEGFNALMSLSCYTCVCLGAVMWYVFQCPLGLIPHFYMIAEWVTIHMLCVSMPSRAYTSFLLSHLMLRPTVSGGVNALSGLYLISTAVLMTALIAAVACQCPLGLIPHFYSTALMVTIGV